MQATRGQVVAAVAVGAVVVLCVALGIRSRDDSTGTRGGPPSARTNAPQEQASPGVSGTAFTESRRTLAPVGSGMEVTALAFGTQDNGYALLARCGPGTVGSRHCDSVLVTTLDGGLSWIERQLPTHGDAELTLVVRGERTVAVGATGAAWYVSVNQGRTWELRPAGPLPYELRPAEFGVICPDPLVRGGCEGPLVEYRPEGPKRFNTEPPLPRLAFDVALVGTALWAVTADAGKVYAAVSLDRGSTWQRRDPSPAAGVMVRPRLTASPDGKEIWISAEQDAGTTALWRYDTVLGTWLVAPPANPRPRLSDVIAVGANRLAAVADNGFGYVVDDGTRWALARQGLFNRFVGLALLTDGTLMARTDNGEIWLGVGTGSDRHWIDVTVLAPRT
jgi:hypothetical protein